MEEPKYIEDFSTRELEEELKHRKEVKRPKPLPSSKIAWDDIVTYLEDEGMSKLDSEQPLPKEFEYWLFKNVMEIVYGPNVWKWWNKKMGKQ